MKEVTAKLRHLNITPRKTRLVADLIRGLNIEEAQRQLQFCQKKAAKPVKKLLQSALANARENYNIENIKKMKIDEIKVNQGPSLRRLNPRAMGRADIIHKRTSHVVIRLSTTNHNS